MRRIVPPLLQLILILLEKVVSIHTLDLAKYNS
jgi:hypothetical protein